MPPNFQQESITAEAITGARSERIQRGVLLAHYGPYLRLAAEQALGSSVRRREDADDLVQQTLMAADQEFASFRGSSEPELTAWIKTILKRKTIALLRRHSAQQRDVAKERSMDDFDSGASISWFSPASRGPSPSHRLVQGEIALRLAAALATLPDNQRDAVRLRHLEGLKIVDVAEQLEVTERSAAGLIRRGIERLRDILSEASWRSIR